MTKYKYILIGGSAGSGPLIQQILNNLSRDFYIPLIFVRHVGLESKTNEYIDILAQKYDLNIKEPIDKETVENGSIYFAPSGYHLLIDEHNTFALSVDEQVNFSRPSIDVLFESAIYAAGENLVGILLSGANRDGSQGLKRIKENGGLTIVQDPETADFPMMVESAMKITEVDYVFSIEEICKFINGLNTIEL